MPGPQRDDVEETVDISDIWEEIIEWVADCLGAVKNGLGMVCFIWGLEWCFRAYDIPSIERFIMDHRDLVAGIACVVLAVAPTIKKLIAALRTGDNGDSENGDKSEVVEASRDRASVGSDGDGEHGIVQPAILTPPAVVTTIPSSSSSRSGGGVSAGSGVVTAADVELGAASHHRRGERERSHGDISGEAVRKGKGKNA